MDKQLIFATNNAHKVREVEDILGGSFRILTLKECGIVEDIPETQPSLEGNALQKARFIHERTKADCFADDTGLFVNALNGDPGVRSARYASDAHDFKANVDLLLRNLHGIADRTASFRTVIALILDGEEYLFEGRVCGTITDDCSGTEGFGYDPIFIPDGYSQTFAQMDPQLKNSISHRAEAVRKLVGFLKG